MRLFMGDKRTVQLVLFLGLLASLLGAAFLGAGAAEAAYGFRQVGTPNVSRFDATAHLLENGKVVEHWDVIRPVDEGVDPDALVA